MSGGLPNLVAENLVPFGFALMLAAAVVFAMLLRPLRVLALRGVALLPALVVVGIWALEVETLVVDRPRGVLLDHIVVESGVTEFQLGADELLQNPNLNGSASRRHVGFRLRDGTWTIANLSPTRRLSLSYTSPGDPKKEVRFFSNRLALAKGDVVEVASESGKRQRIKVTELTADGMTLEVAGTPPTTIKVGPGRTLTINDAPLGRCERAAGETLTETLGLMMVRAKEWLMRGAEERDVLRLGGEVSCSTGKRAVAAVKDVAFAAVQIVAVDNLGYAVIAGRDRTAVVLRAGRQLPLDLVEQPADFVTAAGERMVLKSFVAGHTRYGIRCNDQAAGWCPNAIASGGFQIAPLDDPQRLRGVTPNEALAALPMRPGGNQVRSLPKWSCRMAGEALGNGAGKSDWPRPACPGLFRPSAASGAAGIGLLVWISLLSLPYFKIGRWTWGRRWLERRHASPLLERALRTAAIGLAIAIAIYGFNLYLPAAGIPREAPAPPWFAILAFALALVAAVTARGAGLADGVVLFFWTGLLAFGHVGALALSIELDDLRHLRFADDAGLLITLAAAAVIVVSQVAPQTMAAGFRLLAARGRTQPGEKAGGRWFRVARQEWRDKGGFAVLLLVILIVLVVWAWSGTETGIAGLFQPSEVTKTLLVLLIGVAVTRAIGEERAADRNLPRLRRPLARSMYTLVGIVMSGAVAGLAFFALDGVGKFALFATMAPAILVMVWWLAFRAPPTFAAFAGIAIVLTVILFVPILQHDLSPFLIMGSTAVLSMLLALSVHQVARLTNHLLLPHQDIAPPKMPLRPPIPRLRWSERFEATVWTGTARRLAAVFFWPELWMVVVPITIVAVSFFAGRAALGDATSARAALIEHMRGALIKPVGRFISWVEFNGTPPAGGTLYMEFVDIGLQVARSREVIVGASCRAEMVSREEEKRNELVRARLLPATVGDTAAALPTELLAGAARLGGVQCRYGVDGDAIREGASLIPVVQSDFVGTWLMALFGRDGTLAIILFQFGLISALIGAAFLTMRWTPGHRFDRPTASAAAYTCLGFAVMLAMQWAISWSNALGIVPVMGQPATYLSHGRSHFLGFGLPVILITLASLRLRRTLSEYRPSHFDRFHLAPPRVGLLKMVGIMWRSTARQ